MCRHENGEAGEALGQPGAKQLKAKGTFQLEKK